MRQGQPGVRVSKPGEPERLFDSVEFTKPPRLVTQGGSCWLETDGPVIGTRTPGVKNNNKTPFDQIDWSTVKEQPNHQVSMKVSPKRIVTNDADEKVILDEHGLAPGYQFFWGHNHLHIEYVGDATEIVEMVEP